MAAVKVYGPLYSTATARVLACLFEKAVDFQLIPVDLKKGEHRKPDFLAIQPFGQVPAFQDGDLCLFESRAIMRYVAGKYEGQGSGGLLGRNPRERALVEQWVEVESHNFNPPTSALIFQLALAPSMGLPQDRALIEKNEEKLGKVLDVYEKTLSQSKYLAGDEFTIADLSHIPNTQYLVDAKTGKPHLISSRQHVNRWWEDISARPSWKKVLEMSKPKP